MDAPWSFPFYYINQAKHRIKTDNQVFMVLGVKSFTG